MQGWIKLHRKLINKAIWKTSTPEQKVILITLLMMASHVENEWEWQGKKFTCQPGQFVTSLKSIADNAGQGITIQNVRTALVRFEKYDFLTNQSTKTGRLITIVNWGLYQNNDEVTNKDTNKDLTKHQQRPNKDLTPIKNDKNDKNDKKNLYDENSIEFRLANYLFELIKKNNPNHKKPNLQKWADDMDKILRIDKRPAKEVKLVIEFTQKDSFWKSNVLSVTKLRDKYDQLNIKRLEVGKKDSTKKPHQRLIAEVSSPHAIIGGGDYEIYNPIKNRREQTNG
jgi:hypothetical protein